MSDFCGVHVTHCWHDTGVVLTSNPPQYIEICCHCGTGKTRRRFTEFNPTGHGKYLPGATVSPADETQPEA